MAPPSAALWSACLFVAFLAGCADGKNASASGSDVDFTDFDVQATATTGVIRGVVVDTAIRPVAGVLVLLQATDRSMTTTEDGLFVFDGLEPGTYFLSANKPGYNGTQTSAEVVAGVDEPDVVRVLLVPNPAETPLVETYEFAAFITCGFAVVATSVGCNTYAPVGGAIGDKVYFDIDFTTLPWRTQGELVWKQTQPAGGQMIWEIVSVGNAWLGHRETTASPALAYIDRDTLEEESDTVMENGLTYRIFGGPHPVCTGVFFGCGVTINQKLDVYVHNFYNIEPPEGWRFSTHGPPPN